MTQKKKPYYITTPIYYTNNKLHIGHSYTTVAADTLARYKRAQGYDVRFLTGTDEHGQKIQDSARAAGLPPQQFVDGLVTEIRALWDLLNIRYDAFIRTTDAEHKRRVQAIFQKLYDQGDIYKSEYEGHYCKTCEAFWTESQQVNGCCPDCGKPVEPMKEESYFFKLSKYGDRLIQYIEEHPEFIQPSSRANEMINNFLKPGLQDLAVSRTSFDWGIPVPFDPKHVVYVWIDALSNYITSLGYPEKTDLMEQFWPADVHLVGKEIVRFHTLIWPALLMALDLPLPKQVYGHGWVLFKEGKMSKSQGNVVDPKPLCARYGVDALRYFLMREVPFGADGSYSNEALIARINSDLANDLGNLFSRTLSMTVKYFEGKLPEMIQDGSEDEDLRAAADEALQTFTAHMEQLEFSLALASWWKLIGRANKYIDETRPWILAKDPEQVPRLTCVLSNLLEILRKTSIILASYMPETAGKMQKALKLSTEAYSCESLATWGGFTRNAPLETIAPLFPRLNLEDELDYLAGLLNPAAESAVSNNSEKQGKQKLQAGGNSKVEEVKKENGNPAPEGVQYLKFEDLEKVEMRVGTILSCTRVEGADKLLKEEVQLGEEVRTIVSGIAPWYEPEELVGKQVVCVTNLAPRKLRGVLSQGMLLAANTADGGCRLLTVDGSVPSGAEVG